MGTYLVSWGGHGTNRSKNGACGFYGKKSSNEPPQGSSLLNMVLSESRVSHAIPLVHHLYRRIPRFRQPWSINDSIHVIRISFKTTNGPAINIHRASAQDPCLPRVSLSPAAFSVAQKTPWWHWRAANISIKNWWVSMGLGLSCSVYRFPPSEIVIPLMCNQEQPYLIIYYNILSSKEVWKSNFQQYGEMEK